MKIKFYTFYIYQSKNILALDFSKKIIINLPISNRFNNFKEIIPYRNIAKAFLSTENLYKISSLF